MAYPFGARLDDDSFALTTIDIEIVSGSAEAVGGRTLITGSCELNVTLVIGE